MPVTVNLVSEKQGEIKKFLERFYQKEVNIDDDVGQWIYIYHKPLDAIDLISAVIDNNEDYRLNMSVQIEKGDTWKVTAENYNMIIKGLLFMYYRE